MANTWWVSTLGDDGAGNDGTSYAEAKRTLGGVFALAGLVTGDTINVVNDGNHTWPLTGSEYDVKAGTKGTNFVLGYGLIIRGTDTFGNPELARVKAASGDANGVRSWFRCVANTGYVICRNIIFDATEKTADTAQYSGCRLRDTGTPDPGPIRMEGCVVLGGNSGSVPSGVRALFDIDSTAPPSGEVFEAYACYMQNCRAIMPGDAARQKFFDRILWYIDAGSASVPAFYAQTLSSSNANAAVAMRNCTIFISVGNISPPNGVLDFGVNPAINAGSVDCYSNLVYVQTTSSSAVLTFFRDGVAGSKTGVTYSGIIGYNVLIGGPDVTSADLGSPGWYQNAWDPDRDDAAGADYYPTDTVAYQKPEAEVFANPVSSYAWDMLGNGATILIPKDLRPLAYTTAGYGGGAPGALPLFTPAPEPWVNEVPEVPVIETLEWLTSIVTANNGVNEQRMALRLQPRKSISVDYLIVDETRRYNAYRQLYAAPDGKVRIPYFQYSTFLTQGSAAGSTRLYFDPAKTDVRTGETVIVYRRSDHSFFGIELGALLSDGANTQLPLAQQLYTTDLLVPSEAIIAQERTPIQMSIVSGPLSVEGVVSRVRSQFTRPGSSTSFTTYDSLIVLDKRPNAGAEEGFLRDLDIFDNETGLIDSEAHWLHPFLDGQRSYFIPRVKTPSEMDYWRDFLHAVRGMREPFLLPTWFPDLVLNATPLNNASTIDVVTSDYSSNYFPYDTYKRMKFEAPDGSIIYRKINSVLVLSSTVQRLTLNSALPGTSSWDNGFTISYLNKVRLGSDQVKLTHFGITSIVEFVVRTTDT